MTAEYPHEARPLFAEPYFRAVIAGVIGPEQIAFLKNLPMVPHQGNLISDNLYIFEAPELRSVWGAVQEVLDIYARDVLCIPQRLYVTQSWVQAQLPNYAMQNVAYGNSLLSGVLYYEELLAPPPSMIFARHDTYQQIDLTPEAGKRSVFNAPHSAVAPAQNEVLLFTSRLTHRVEPNLTGQPRLSIGFATFVKGTLGTYRGVSELTL
jgi:Putative 2OG-Fe(II) oxygenase